jgi:enoyl-CoA hydratase/carnithine racemase
MMDAAEALRIGLANQVVPPEALDAAGLAYTDKLLSRGRAARVALL